MDSLADSPYYVKIGTPHNHAGTNDPCRSEAPTSLHFYNHYGTGSLRQALQHIAIAYASLHPDVKLRINDMSLELGGLFDFNNNWNTPHSEHRLGQNADVGFTGINQANECVNLNLEHLRNAIDDYTTGPTLAHGGDQPHFHVRHLKE